MLALPPPDLRALVSGEVVLAFVARGGVTEGDEVELTSSGPRVGTDLKPAYARWAGEPAPPGVWTAVVDAVDPTTVLDPIAGDSRHILARVPDGDLAILRVYGPEGPVLSDIAYAARRRSIEGALRG